MYSRGKSNWIWSLREKWRSIRNRNEKDQLYLENKFGFEKAEFFWNIGLDAVKNVTNLISEYTY